MRGNSIKHETFIVECPGCKTLHQIWTTGPVKWSFNGDYERPTFSPSLFVNPDGSNPTVPKCHSFIRNGIWEFLSDCTHELAGQKVPMIEVE
nr:DUF6527 family protein [Bowmanella dokdonensis]